MPVIVAVGDWAETKLANPKKQTQKRCMAKIYHAQQGPAQATADEGGVLRYARTMLGIAGMQPTSKDRFQTTHRIIYFEERRIEWRQTEAQHVGFPEIWNHALRYQGL